MPVFVLLRSKYTVKRTNKLNFVLLTVTFIHIPKVEDSNLQSPAPLLIVCVMGKLKLLESCSRGMTAYFSNMTIEKVASLACLALGTVFLFMAVFGPWKYYFPMTLSYIAAFIVTEDREH